eukprot:TRINITY_DN7114_c0_g1_i1.p1 TRINITY_DN7114_c0_g1~~TRINITY_DN7114_c0_g1_i1.p1  ORF type:complete len:505 (+),score=113.84 TRINITY_DN7114_c0_g1_i1:107-1516(+)
MAAAQFSDDAYNKQVMEVCAGGAGTLIGNWFEERVLRDSCGEGRSVPQRHMPRSGLLTDWTKIPSGGPRKQDNTFERVYGPKANVKHVPFSKQIGGGEDDIFGDTPVAATLQAAGRIPRVGQKELAARKARQDAAEEAVQQEEEILEARAQERYFETTAALHFGKPDMAQTELPTHTRASCKLELLHGPAPDRVRGLNNEGMEVPAHVHYSNLEAPTHARMSFADERMRNDLQASAALGVTVFGKNNQFTKSTGECLLGLSKDEALDVMFQSRAQTKPMRTLGGSVPRGAPFGDVPSLAILKEAIHRKLYESCGPTGYVVLRQRLFDGSDEEGFVKKPFVLSMLRDEFGVNVADVSDKALDVYISQLITMKKDELHVSSFMSSLRPALPLKDRRGVIEAFEAMTPVDGAVRLGTYLDKVEDPVLKDTIVTAFGAQGDAASVADMPITEAIFTELVSDLAPFNSLDGLLC